MTTKRLETQKKILSSARQIFLKKGFSGTSMSQIAKEANVAKALLFHYFKTKEDLWKNVKDEVIGQNIIENLNCVPTDSFEHFIEFIIDARFTLYGENQDLVLMMNWQRLEVQEEIAGTTSLPADMWKKELEQFQSKGEINEKIDTTLLQNLIFSLSSLPFLEKWEWSENKEKLEEYKILLKRTVSFIARNR